MIVQALIDIAFSLLKLGIGVIPEINWSIDTSSFEMFIGMMQVSLYVLPIQTIHEIMGIVLWLIGFRLAISIIKTIWELIPVA